MARAVEFAHVLDAGRADQALAVAAAADWFGDGDLASILDHLAAAAQPGPVVPDLSLWSTKPTPLGPGTAGWGRVGA